MYRTPPSRVLQLQSLNLCRVYPPRSRFVPRFLRVPRLLLPLQRRRLLVLPLSRQQQMQVPILFNQFLQRLPPLPTPRQPLHPRRRRRAVRLNVLQPCCPCMTQHGPLDLKASVTFTHHHISTYQIRTHCRTGGDHLPERHAWQMETRDTLSLRLALLHTLPIALNHTRINTNLATMVHRPRVVSGRT